MDWFLYDMGLRHERVKKMNTDQENRVKKHAAESSNPVEKN